ncbi:MAG: hypothetical protein V4496_04105 [Pseudomonadota bacterium]
MLSKLKAGILFVFLSYSCSAAIAAADWSMDISFSNIHAISHNVSNSQCEALFQPFRVTEKAIANIKQEPIAVSSSNEIISLYRPSSSKDNQSEPKKFGFWQGMSNISLDGGKTFLKVSFSTLKDPITKEFTIIIPDYCKANYVAHKTS